MKLLPLLLFLLSTAAQAVESRPPQLALADVRRIYVDQLGGGKTSDQFRDMLISAIQNSGLFTLTENEARADAVIKGSGDDIIFTEDHSTSDAIGIHANATEGSSSRALNAGSSSNNSRGIGVSDSESSHVQDRRHEATGSVRLVNREGDIIWSSTQESGGGKFRSAMADVADKLVRQLIDETRKMRELTALKRDSTVAVIAPPPTSVPTTPKTEDPDGPPRLVRRDATEQAVK